MYEQPEIKILPINLDPIIKTYSFNGFYIGILEGHNIDITDLLFKEFLHIFYFKYQNKGHLDFTGSGYVEPNRFHIKKFEIKDNSYICEIKKEISSLHYFMVNLNEKYIKNEQIHKSSDVYHDWLIYGYNDVEKRFICAGYIGNEYENNVYTSVEIPYDEIEQAILHINNFNNHKALKLINHITYINENWTEKLFTAEQLQKEIKSYCFPPLLRFRHRLFINNDIHGMQKFIQSFYEEHVLFYSKPSTEQDCIFLQDFRTIFEHKKVIQLAIMKITKDSQLLELQQKIVNSAYTNLLLAYRYNSHQQEKGAQKIYRNLLSLEEEEKVLIEKLLNISLPNKKHMPV